MMERSKKQKIKVTKDGPYIVFGNVPLYETIITPTGDGGYEFQDGRKLPQSEEYALCRCGKSKNAPFCDGTHKKAGFVGTETAENTKYEDRAELLEGFAIDLLDDNRCAFARFCHRNKGNAWELTENSYDQENKEEAIKAASDCPSGRLTSVDKKGKMIEPVYEPAIDIIQDPEEGVSGGIFVKGNIPIESSDGFEYEIRNRVVLCRCGESDNKPFCDATHVSIKFIDKHI